MIFILNRSEKVVGVLNNKGDKRKVTPYFDDLLSEDLATGTETFKFTTLAGTQQAKFLVTGNYIAIQRGRKTKLFQITEIEETHEDNMFIDVYCETAGLELINKVVRPREIASANLRQYLETILNETGWNVGYVDSSLIEVLTLNIDQYTSVLSALQNVSLFGGELEFRCEVKNGYLASKYVDVYAHRGRFTGKRFEYGKDIEKISRKINSTNIATALIGVGKNNTTFKSIEVRDDAGNIIKPLGQDFIVDQEAYDKYNNNGYHIFGIFNYDTDSPEELYKKTVEEMENRTTPQVEYEVSVVLLSKLLGRGFEKVEIGDTVYIIDNDMQPAIHLAGRVTKLETSETDPYSDKCTLANFIEVQSSITDEMRQLANELQGIIDSKFPIKENDIENNAITSDKIMQGAITNDKIGNLSADKITAGQISADRLVAGVIQAINLTSDTAVINSAKIGELDASKITTGELSAEVIKGNVIDAINLTSSTATINGAKIGELNANQITAGQIDASKINVTNIDASNIVAGVIDASKIKVTNIDASQITSGSISADIIEGLNITADMITTGVLDAKLVEVIDLNADNITSGSIDANKIKVKNLSANSIVSGTIDASKIDVTNINAGNINTGTLDAQLIEVLNLSANSITSGTIDASKIKVKNLSASDITTGTIDATKVTINNLNAGSITTGSLNCALVDLVGLSADKITTGTLNAERVKIQNLMASSIVGGTLDTTRVNLLSSSGNMSIVDNTIQIRDNQTVPVTRVQIGKDATNNYGIIVQNANGNVIFDSEVGVYEQGISNNAVTTDKIRDDSIPASKLQVDEIFSNEAVIGKIQTVELNADKIVTGKISSEFLDIEGIVSFKGLDTDLQSKFIFDENLNETFINGGTIQTQTLTGKQINTRGFTARTNDNEVSFNIDDETGNVTLSGTVYSSNYSEVSNTGYMLSPDGNATLNQATIRGSVILPNAGITDEGKDPKSIRIWAGSTDKEQAKFKVLHDGTVIATEGQFDGTFTGSINIGNITIEDTLETNGAITFSNNDNTRDLLKFSEEQSFINTPFVFGTPNKKSFEFDYANNKLKVFSVFNMENSKVNSVFNEGATIIETSDKIDKGNYLQEIKNGSYSFISNGTQNGEDYIFAKEDPNQSIQVNIKGELIARDKIKMNCNIEIVARNEKGNSGFDYVVK